MAGCEAFEIAVEKRLHGAPGDSEEATIEEHLAGCERCPAYQALARGSEAGPRVEASAAAAEVDWARVERESGGASGPGRDGSPGRCSPEHGWRSSPGSRRRRR